MRHQKKYIIVIALLLCVPLLGYMALHGKTQASQTTFLLAEGLSSQTECHILDSGKKGPVIFLLAGTHGNEIAGFQAAERLAEELRPITGRIILIPHANAQAIKLNQRTGPGGEDMNRSYPGNPEGNDIEVLTCQIIDLIKEQKPVCVVDMHEGVNFYGVEGSIGNSLVVGQTQSSFSHALDVLEQVNGANGENPDFALEGNAPSGSLNCTVSRELDIDSFTIETSKKLPLETRISQQILFIKSFLTQYGMKYELTNV